MEKICEGTPVVVLKRDSINTKDYVRGVVTKVEEFSSSEFRYLYTIECEDNTIRSLTYGKECLGNAYFVTEGDYIEEMKKRACSNIKAINELNRQVDECLSVINTLSSEKPMELKRRA